MKEMQDFISVVGYSIFCSLALGYVLWKAYNKMVSTLDKVTDTNKELVKTNIILINKVDNTVNDIEDKVEKIL